DGERADAREHVSAIASVVDDRLRDPDLAEQIVHVGARSGRRADDRDLAGERLCAAQAVDLTGVRAAVDREDRAVAGGRIGWQVLAAQECAAARSATHDHAPYRQLVTDHTRGRPQVSDPHGRRRDAHLRVVASTATPTALRRWSCATYARASRRCSIDARSAPSGSPLSSAASSRSWSRNTASTRGGLANASLENRRTKVRSSI